MFAFSFHPTFTQLFKFFLFFVFRSAILKPHLNQNENQTTHSKRLISYAHDIRCVMKVGMKNA
jgi:hypothetical protein